MANSAVKIILSDPEEAGSAVYENLVFMLDGVRLPMPTSMRYTEEGIYDNTPAQLGYAKLSRAPEEQPEGEGEYARLSRPPAFEQSRPRSPKSPKSPKTTLKREKKKAAVAKDEGGAGEGNAPMRGDVNYSKGQISESDVNARAAALLAEPIVHESDLRLAFKKGEVLYDPDRGQKCKQCDTCPGFDAHFWRKVCKWCRCSRVKHESGIKELSDQSIASTDGQNLGKKRYSWQPSGLSAAQVEKYFQSIPEANVPLIGSAGEQWRREQLYMQMPPYDMDYKLCDQMTQKEKDWWEQFDALRVKEALDIGSVVPCPDLSRPPDCKECFLKSDGTHWPYCSKFIPPAEELKHASASSLGLPSGAASGTGSIRSYHSLVVDPADMPSIKTMKHKKKDAAPVVPVTDAPKKKVTSGLMCRGCCLPLYVDELVVEVGRFADGDAYFHPRCFMCSQCGELLVDLRCFVDVGWEERGKEGAEQRLFCGRDWSNNRRPRCTACDETIHEVKHVFELGTTWHFRHFSCYICDANLTAKMTYVPRDGKPLCFDCFSEHIADKCVVCNKAIIPTRDKGGKISIGDKNWHAKCFSCKICGENLEGKPCVPKHQYIYCKDCFKKHGRK